MTKKNIIKIVIDCLMLCDFIILMCHEVIRNLQFHGYSGIALFCLFIIHHVLNLSFYKSAFKGEYNSTRIIFTITDLCLFVFMILMAVSSVLMSGFIFESVYFSGSQFARKLHNFSCAWGFLLMGFHLGLHVHVPLERLEVYLLEKNLVLYSLLESLLLIITGAAVVCFFTSHISFYLFMLNGWKHSAPNLIICLLENCGMLLGMMVLGHIVRLKFFKNLNLKSKRRN